MPTLRWDKSDGEDRGTVIGFVADATKYCLYLCASIIVAPDFMLLLGTDYLGRWVIITKL